jgi:hypothetical protein
MRLARGKGRQGARGARSQDLQSNWSCRAHQRLFCGRNCDRATRGVGLRHGSDQLHGVCKLSNLDKLLSIVCDSRRMRPGADAWSWMKFASQPSTTPQPAPSKQSNRDPHTPGAAPSTASLVTGQAWPGRHKAVMYTTKTFKPNQVTTALHLITTSLRQHARQHANPSHPHTHTPWRPLPLKSTLPPWWCGAAGRAPPPRPWCSSCPRWPSCRAAWS